MGDNKFNKGSIEGDNNILIQDVSNSNITINVSGKELRLEAAMNQWLVQYGMQAIEAYSPFVKRFYDEVANIPDWPNQLKYRNASLAILQSSYIGTVGIYLKKLAAIGCNSFSAEKMKEYIKIAYLLSLRLLDLVNSLLISSLWDQTKKQKPELGEHEMLRQFFTQSVERDMNFSYSLLVELMRIFKTNKLEYPLSEISMLENIAAKDSELHGAFDKIEQLFTKSSNQEPDGEDSFWTEKKLTDLLVHFNFLAKYKIQSVKKVDYYHLRNLEDYYIHKLNFYGLSSRAADPDKSNTVNIRYSNNTIYTDAVIIYETDYNTGISLNLFPFIIDYSNLLLEEGTNLCLFSHKDLSGSNLKNFICIANNTFVGIEANENKVSKDFSEIYADKDSIIQYKKNCIVHLLEKVRKEILGDEDN